MSSLTGAEKRWLEKAFDMGGGYVLDFTNPSFERFFNDYGVDIYSAPYEIHGTSKANRLRAFWDIESDELVGRVLVGLLDSSEFLDRDSVEIRKSREGAARLTGMSLEESYLYALKGRNQETELTSEERQVEHLWGTGLIRVFISHISQYKIDAMTIKDALEVFGIASFVAHSDIEPTEEWQTEIERALHSMDLFIALLTEGFKESNWTDQEVGFALARKAPILPINRGTNPYGFIGKYQALKWSGPSAFPIARKALQMALMRDELESFAKDSFLAAVSSAETYDRANELSHVMPDIDSLTPVQAERLVNAFNSNRQVRNANAFKGRISGDLRRMTGNSFALDEAEKLHQLREIEEIEDIPF